MLYVNRGQLVLLHEKMIEGVRQLAGGLRMVADQVVAEQTPPEEVAEALRELARSFDSMAENG